MTINNTVESTPLADQDAAFLADIGRHPNDNSLRLVYADWLEDVCGQAERAEFIRGQIALSSGKEVDQAITDERRQVLEARCDDLLRQHPEWALHILGPNIPNKCAGLGINVQARTTCRGTVLSPLRLLIRAKNAAGKRKFPITAGTWDTLLASN